MELRDSVSDDTRSVADKARDSVWAIRLLWIFVVWAIGPLVYAIGDFILFVLPGHKAAQSYHQWLMGNFLSKGALFLFWVFLCTLVSLVIILVTAHRDDDSDYQMSYRPRELHKNVPHHRRAGMVTFIVFLVTFIVMIGSLVQFIRVAHNDSIVPVRYYGPQTTFFVDGTINASNAQSLTRLLPELTPSNGSSGELVGTPSLPATVKQGSLPTTGWDPRVSSLNGAIYGIKHSSATVQNVSLNVSTVTYLNAWHGQPARWSGILDGSGNGTGLGGIAEWDGNKVTSTCKFAGPYAADRSFGGSGDADLNDKLAQTYPALHYNMSDVWGYCDGTQPIVVIPMIRQVYFGSRTVNAAAGIVKVQGNYNQTVLTYQASAQPGEYPGPVFPASIVDSQVSQVNWAAGRRWHDSGNFGFEPVSSAVQAGNVSDYLLRDSATGRLMWVTPLTLNGSTSDLIVAYAVSYADQVSDGQLNPLSIYILGPNDPRQVVIDNMESQARTWLSQQVSGFFSSGGILSEFTPLGGNMWRAYGEVNGRVQYLMDFDATNVSTAKLTLVGQNPTTGTKLNCDDPSQLTEAQIATCIERLSQYLAQHAGVGASTAPSH
jgi:hypothetical protein